MLLKKLFMVVLLITIDSYTHNQASVIIIPQEVIVCCNDFQAAAYIPAVRLLIEHCHQTPTLIEQNLALQGLDDLALFAEQQQLLEPWMETCAQYQQRIMEHDTALQPTEEQLEDYLCHQHIKNSAQLQAVTFDNNPLPEATDEGIRGSAKFSSAAIGPNVAGISLALSAARGKNALIARGSGATVASIRATDNSLALILGNNDQGTALQVQAGGTELCGLSASATTLGSLTVNGTTTLNGPVTFGTESSARFTDSTNATATLQAPTTYNASYVLTLPTSAGSPSQVLSTNGSGVLSWTDPALLTGTVNINHIGAGNTTIGSGSNTGIVTIGNSSNNTANAIIIQTGSNGLTGNPSIILDSTNIGGATPCVTICPSGNTDVNIGRNDLGTSTYNGVITIGNVHSTTGGTVKVQSGTSLIQVTANDGIYMENPPEQSLSISADTVAFGDTGSGFQAQLFLSEYSGNGGYGVSVQAPLSMSEFVTLTLPATQGTDDNQALVSDNAGNLSFQTVSTEGAADALVALDDNANLTVNGTIAFNNGGTTPLNTIGSTTTFNRQQLLFGQLALDGTTSAVTANGTTTGTGFAAATALATGTAQINFTTPYSANPIVVATISNSTTGGETVLVSSVGASSFIVKSFDNSNNPKNLTVSFYVVGTVA